MIRPTCEIVHQVRTKYLRYSRIFHLKLCLNTLCAPHRDQYRTLRLVCCLFLWLVISGDFLASVSQKKSWVRQMGKCRTSSLSVGLFLLTTMASMVNDYSSPSLLEYRKSALRTPPAANFLFRTRFLDIKTHVRSKKHADRQISTKIHLSNKTSFNFGVYSTVAHTYCTCR